MPKLLKFKEDARKRLLRGVEIVYDAVSSTLGPKGYVAVIGREYGSPLVVGDGVTVAKEIDLEDPFEDLGAKITIEASSKTNDGAGDGTTGTVVLTYAIVSEALKNVSAGANPMMLRRGINKAVEEVVKTLKERSNPVSEKQIQQVANISAQDEKIGEMIAGIIKKMGRDAVITVEEAKTNEMSIEYRDGMQFSKGFVSEYFITNPANQEALLDNPYVLLLSEKLNDLQGFAPFLDRLAREAGKKVVVNNEEGYIAPPLVIICDDIDPAPLTFIIKNRASGALPTIVIKSPDFGDKRKAILQDLAILTGGQVIGGDTGTPLADASVGELGRADVIVSTKDNTTILGGKGDKKLVEERVKGLRKEMSNPDTNDFDREKLQERIAKLSSGIAIINVGANSEVEMRERKERVIDAVSAVRAALEEGIVPGGETALLEARYCLNGIGSTDEERLGVKIIQRAMEKPFLRLMENSGYNPGEMKNVYEKEAGKDEGVDVIDGQVKNLVEHGIIDPVMVTRKSLENAASAAVMIMTAGVAIAIDNKKDTKVEDI